MTKRLTAAALAASVLMAAAPAAAADLGIPVRQAPVLTTAYDWTGFYAGVHAGYGIDRESASSSSFSSDAGSISSSRTRFGGALGGLQAGYNWQVGRLVLGAEADVTLPGLSKRESFNLDIQGVQAEWVARHRLGTFGTLRARLGYAAGPYLVYATGGVAAGNLKTEMSLTTDDLGVGSGYTSRFVFGSAVGGGLEAMLTPNWSVKAEYLYIHLPKQSVGSFLGEVSAFGSSFHFARAGLNYRF